MLRILPYWLWNSSETKEQGKLRGGLELFFGAISVAMSVCRTRVQCRNEVPFQFGEDTRVVPKN